MTTDEFLAELSAVARQFDWTLSADTRGNTERRRRPRLHLKATPLGEPAAIFDLLGAVCYAQTGKTFEARSWPVAARELGLSPTDAARLLAAAHDQTWEDRQDGSRRPVEELLTLRKRVLDATGVLLPRAAHA